MAKLTVRALNVNGKRVLVRVDFNVPMDANGEITDDRRIHAALPTINYLLSNGATVILASHLGKPKGKPNPKLSLRPVADRLAKILDRQVYFAPDCVGSNVVRFLQKVPPNSLALLENLRFHPGEEKNERDFAKALATLADLYVNDAFGTAHRAHASTTGVTAFFAQPVAGLLMEKELQFLTPLLETPPQPFIVIIGGAKISDKAGVIKNLLPRVDRLLIGGGVAFNFLKARGYPIGKSIWEPNLMAEVVCLEKNPKIVLPVDVVVTSSPDTENGRTVEIENIGPDEIGLDIGDKTIHNFTQIITTGKTVVWAGPMGMFEKHPFQYGTIAIAQAIAVATENGATTVAGGGDTIATLKKAGVSDRLSHISTGGSATLEFLEGKELPGITALMDEL